MHTPKSNFAWLKSQKRKKKQNNCHPKAVSWPYFKVTVLFRLCSVWEGRPDLEISTQWSLAGYADTPDTIIIFSWGLQTGRMWQLIIPVYQAMRQCAGKRPQLLFLICEISPCLVWKSLVSVVWGAYRGNATLLHLFTSRTEKTTQTVFFWAKTAPVHLLIRNHLMLDMIAIKSFN